MRRFGSTTVIAALAVKGKMGALLLNAIWRWYESRK
jgi:hypothetical protein